jgi:hypothetical protein
MMDTFEEKPKRGGNNISGLRSNTGAMILIGLGVVLLLANFGILNGIGQLWPLVFVGVGVWLLMGKGTKVEIKHEHYSALIGGATSARVKLSLPIGESTIREVDDASTLIDADMNFVGEMVFNVQGETEKTVNLSQTSDSWQSWMNPANWNWDAGKQLHSTIGLSKSVPMVLDIHGGVGKSDIDLSRMRINNLDVNGGVGEIIMTLPTTADSLNLRAQVGVGRMELTVPVAINLGARIKGGVGETSIRLPADAAVRLEANSGVGGVTVGSRLQKISGDNGNFGLGKDGVWETANYSSAATKISIHYDGGVGQLIVR